jgi:hypothetical protein|tara:strand:+ start:238 stop:438 length:201 start_codon:yes stop_codon:yes gene_type:complete
MAKNNLKKRLSNEWLKINKVALRDPRTTKEMAVRMRLHRIESIVRSRYGQDYMFELQGQRLHKAEV